MRFLFLVILLCAGCASVEQNLNPKIFYEHAMNVEVNEKLYKGFGVIPLAKKYKMKIWGRGKMDFLRITTCHREITKNKEGSRFKFDFIPIPEMEMRKNGPNQCLMYFESYEQKRGRNDWAILDFDTPFETLEATDYCNGRIRQGSVTLCHSRQGLKQKLVFQEVVDLSKQTRRECRIKSLDGKVWKYSMTKHVCSLSFRDRKTKSKYHRHTNVGYEDVLIPAGE